MDQEPAAETAQEGPRIIDPVTGGKILYNLRMSAILRSIAWDLEEEIENLTGLDVDAVDETAASFTTTPTTGPIGDPNEFADSIGIMELLSVLGDPGKDEIIFEKGIIPFTPLQNLLTR